MFTENIKVYDFKGNKSKEIIDSNHIFFIDTYYDKDLSKIYIITSNEDCIKSYDYHKNELYYKYCENCDNNVWFAHCNPIIYSKSNLVEIIDACYEGNIRIWNFNSGDLIMKIEKINDDFFKISTVCLWDEDYLYIGCNDKVIKLIEIKSGNIISNLEGHNESISCIKKLNHPKYGECLVSQGQKYDQIKLWIDKNKMK